MGINALPHGVHKTAVGIINRTPPGDIGYDDASCQVQELWNVFDDEGASCGDLDTIMGFIRWAKMEGFGEGSPISEP